MRAVALLPLALFTLAFALAPVGASAQANLLSEREAREQGREFLRQGKFAEAIAAFAQSAKCWPGPQRDPDDPRTSELVRAFDEVWEDLRTSGRPEADRLPYADFFVSSFPFFDSSFSERGVQRWTDMALLAAEIRLRGADPHAERPEFDRCRAIAGSTGPTGGEQVLAFLESPEWPIPHEDFGICALRAFLLLERRVAHGPVRDEMFLARSWSAYARRFADARCLGWAARNWSRQDEAETVATDPVALRWCRAGLVPNSDNPEGREAAWNRLAESAAPWMTPALAAAWVVADQAVVQRDSPPTAREGLRAAWRRMKERHAGSPEFGMASFALLWAEYRWNEHEREGEHRDFLREWTAAAPQDPFLSWARLACVKSRLYWTETAVLSDPERAELLEWVSRHPREAIAASANLVLALDDARRGEGHEARRRYEEVARLDPDGVCLPAAGDPRNAIGEAREKLYLYYRRRDPRRAAELGGNPIFSWSPHMSDDLMCGNAASEIHDWHERRHAARLAEAGLIDEAIEDYWKAVSTPNWHGPDSEAALAFADLCVSTERTERIERAVASLNSLQEEEDRRNPKFPARSFLAQADLLEEYRSVLDLAEAEGAVGIARKLAMTLRQWRSFEQDYSPRSGSSLEVVLSAARQSPRTIAEVPSHLVHPITPLRLLLARLAPSSEAMRYVVGGCPAMKGPEPGELSGTAALAEQALLANPRAALRAMLDRVRTDGPAVWQSLRSFAHQMPFEARWLTHEEHGDDPSPEIRELCRMELGRMRREDPWWAYCLESE